MKIIKLRNKIDFITEENIKLKNIEEENIELKNNLKQYENKIKLLLDENIELLNKIESIEINNNNIKKNEDINILKNNEIQQLKSKYLLEGEELMTIIFYGTNQKIHYSLICTKKDKFITLESSLFEAYPEFQEAEYFFMVNGNKINRFKTIEENHIVNSQVVLVSIN